MGRLDLAPIPPSPCGPSRDKASLEPAWRAAETRAAPSCSRPGTAAARARSSRVTPSEPVDFGEKPCPRRDSRSASVSSNGPAPAPDRARSCRKMVQEVGRVGKSFSAASPESRGQRQVRPASRLLGAATEPLGSASEWVAAGRRSGRADGCSPRGDRRRVDGNRSPYGEASDQAETSPLSKPSQKRKSARRRWT